MSKFEELKYKVETYEMMKAVAPFVLSRIK